MIKGFLNTLIGVTLGTEAIKQVGDMPSGLKSVTQSAIGIGVFGVAAKNAKNIFKIK